MLLRLAEVELPTAPEVLFGRTGPLVLEVGFGDGRFMADMARRHPAWNWLGAEVSGVSTLRALKRMKREGVRQVRLFHGHASVLLRNVVPPCALQRAYVNFPDPWPKERHRAKRLLQVPFFRLLSTRLVEGGVLLLTTDHEEYFRYALDQGRETDLFRIDVVPPPPETLATKYALKWREQHKPIRHAVFTKTAEHPSPFPPIERFAMPHAILDGALPRIEDFRKQVHPYDDGHVVMLRAYRGLAQKELVFLVHVDEDDLEQEVLVEARPHADGVIVGLQRFGSPLITKGVKEAVRCVTLWLEAQGMRAVKRSY